MKKRRPRLDSGYEQQQPRERQSSAARTGGGIYREVTIAGSRYVLSQPKKVGVYKAIEAFIFSRKTPPEVFAIRACKRAPAEQHPIIWKLAMEEAARPQFITDEEYLLFQKSKWSLAVTLFNTLDPKHRDEIPDVDAAMELILEEASQNGQNIDELTAQVGVVQQDRELGNSAGRTGSPEPASHATDSHASADGPPCISTSPIGSDGQA